MDNPENTLAKLERVGIDGLEAGDLNNFRSILPSEARGVSDHLFIARESGLNNKRHRDFLPRDNQAFHSDKFLKMTPEKFYALTVAVIGECGLDLAEIARLHDELEVKGTQVRLHDRQNSQELEENMKKLQESIELCYGLYKYTLPVAKALLRRKLSLMDITG